MNVPSWSSLPFRARSYRPGRMIRPPLVGFVYPPIDVLPGVHSRRSDLAAVPTSGPGCRPGHRVPSSRFLTASTAFSALTFAPKRSGRGVAGLLHPAADPGVRRVSLRPPRPTVAGVPERRLSRDAVRTPRRIPLACSRTVSPRPLPPCRSSWRVVALAGNPLPGAPVYARLRFGRRLRGFAPPASP
jgi:hypothetical protein